MYHENIRSIAGRWKDQIDNLKQKLENENQKSKSFVDERAISEAETCRLKADCDSKKRRIYENQVTLKTLEDAKISSLNAISNMERQVDMQEKSNKMDTDAFRTEWNELENNIIRITDAMRCTSFEAAKVLKPKY